MNAKGNREPYRQPRKCCKILSVEDDISYQAALINALKTLNYGGREAYFLTANSAQEAANIIAQNPDIALVLLDVVMEDDDSGLRLVRSIRDVVGNQQIRIVLVTGQPGMMPLDDLMASYDIDDYWNKSELTHDHLQTIVLGNIRTWEHVTAMQQARQGLQMLIESSQRISSKLDLKSYTQSILQELANVFRLDKGGIVCMAHKHDEVPSNALVFAAAGIYQDWNNRYLNGLSVGSDMLELIAQCLSAQCHIIDSPLSALYFSSESVDQRDYVVVVRCEQPLSSYEIDLLQIFGENINAGFSNVALHNRLSELAYSDRGTGLNNKNWFVRQLNQLASHERQQMKLLMLFVEELSYSEVLFGVGFGRTLMTHLAAHLKACFIKAIDIVLYERDTLLVLIYDQQDYDRESLEDVLHPQLDIDGTLHSVDIIGALVRLADLEAKDASQILGVTKSFLEQTKHQNLDFAEFDVLELDQLQERYELMKKLRHALRNEQFFIHLQPKVCMKSGALLGFEVLVRWRDEEGNMIAPDRFIPLAETSGLIDKLDNFVTQQACHAIKRFEAQGKSISLSVNVAGSEVSRSGFAQRFYDDVLAMGVKPEQIAIEVTETQLIEVTQTASACLDRLEDLGINVSIDDFGAGYSSLSYLSLLKVDELKIDRQFIQRMEETERDNKIVKMIVDLGHLLNMTVTAEGIETQTQFEALKAMGCDVGQGYYIAKPMSLEEALQWTPEHFTEKF